jgi:hypothetical protein
MVDSSRGIYDEVKRNDRYFLPILGAFILGLLLLFYKDLDPWIQKKLIPAYVVYLMGAALIAQVQNMLGVCAADASHRRSEHGARFVAGLRRRQSVVVSLSLLLGRSNSAKQRITGRH